MSEKKKAIMLIVVGVMVAVGIFLLLMWLHKPEPELVPEEPITKREESVGNISLNVNGRDLKIRLSGNSSAKALYERLADETVTVIAEDYGGFEKVGELGFSLPENNEEITTKVGDLILYQGNKLSLYYGANTYELTRLGEVEYAMQPELKDILGDGAVTMVLKRID